MTILCALDYNIPMKKRRGFLLLEVLICLVLLVLISAILIGVFLNFRNLMAKLHYRNTAYSLMRDIIEFGEADIVLLDCNFAYEYKPAKDVYESTCTSKFPLCTSTAVPAGECCMDPFIFLDDIKAKNLVPEKHPDSVKMKYWSTVSRRLPDGTKLPCADAEETNCRQYFTIHVSTEWIDRGQKNQVELSVAPVSYAMTQGFSLQVKDFWEE